MDGSSTFGNPVLDLLVVVILILVGGFFAASEIALITVKRHRLSQLAEDGERRRRAARRLTEDPSRFLATIQIAITFLGFLAGAVGAAPSLGHLAALIDGIPMDLIRTRPNRSRSCSSRWSSRSPRSSSASWCRRRWP